MEGWFGGGRGKGRGGVDIIKNRWEKNIKETETFNEPFTCSNVSDFLYLSDDNFL